MNKEAGTGDIRQLGRPKLKITENTKVTINLVLMVSMIIYLIGAGFFVGTKIEHIESRIEAGERLDLEHPMLYLKAEENSNCIIAQNLLLIEIQTDLKWIRLRMEEENAE